MKKKEWLFICQFAKTCKARDYCSHAIAHEKRSYSKGNFMFESCTIDHQCPYQEIPIRCRKVKEKKNGRM